MKWNAKENGPVPPNASLGGIMKDFKTKLLGQYPLRARCKQLMAQIGELADPCVRSKKIVGR